MAVNARVEHADGAETVPWDDPDGLAEATRLFRKAVEIDPGYGNAHALLAAICCTNWQEDASGSDAALLEGTALAKRAVELDETESTAIQYWAGLICCNDHLIWRCNTFGARSK